MLARREPKLDWLSRIIYCLLPLPKELQRIAELLPEEKLLEAARPYYSDDQGRPSEDPLLLFKIMFLSFFYGIPGDRNTLETLKYRIDWRQFCGLSLLDTLPDRTTLVKFRRIVGATMIHCLFTSFVETLVDKGLLDRTHRFFDGTFAQARAQINPYRDEIYEEPLSKVEEKIASAHRSETVTLAPELNPSPVELTKDEYPVDQEAAKARRAEPMKPVADRQAAGDPDAHFQRGKHGKPSQLGYEHFFSIDSHQLFIDGVDVAKTAGQGQRIFIENIKASEPGQMWSVDMEFSTGEILAQAEEHHVIVNTPPRPASNSGLYPKRDFVYQAETDTYTCPNFETLSHVSTNSKTEDKTYRTEKGTCLTCALREQCTTSKSESGRSITRSKYEAQFERQRDHARTPEAVMGRVLRGIVSEGKFAEAARHGLQYMRYVGHTMALMQGELVASILNLKRFVRLEVAGGLA
jgi:transposase